MGDNMGIIKNARKFVTDQLGGTTGSSNEYRYPYTSPNRSGATTPTNTLFQTTVTDAELKEMSERVAVATVIISGFSDDLFRKGFAVKADPSNDAEPSSPEAPPCGQFASVIGVEPSVEETEQLSKEEMAFNNRFQVAYEKMVKPELIRSYKFARLYGYSLLLIGYQDKKKLSEAPSIRSKIGFFQAIPKTWVNEVVYKTDADGNVLMPATRLYYKMTEKFGDSAYIHPKRVVFIANPGTDEMQEGVSALLSVFDDLTVLRHILWSSGQSLWRAGSPLTIATGPPRASQTQIDAIDTAVTDIDSTTSLTMPYGADVSTLNTKPVDPTGFQKIPLDNIAAATRIPITQLIGSASGAVASSVSDSRDYSATLDTVQSNILTPVITEIFERLQLSGNIKTMNSFAIEWVSNLTSSEAEDALTQYRNALSRRINLEADELQGKLAAGVQPEGMVQPPGLPGQQIPMEQPPYSAVQPTTGGRPIESEMERGYRDV